MIHRTLRRAGLLATLLVLCALPAGAQSTNHLDGMSVSLHAGAGYTSFSMIEATDFFRAVVGVYQDEGINIPVQQTYPGNAIARGGLSIDVDGWTAGVDLHYARSEAAALYGDIGGTLDVTSVTSVLTIESTLAYTFRRTKRLQPILGARVGRAVGRYSIRESIRLTIGGASEESFAELDARGVGFSFSGFAGARYPIGPIFIRAEAGYRHAWIGNEEDDLAFNIGYSGPMATLGIEIPVWRSR